jgi:hypothetical protein
VIYATENSNKFQKTRFWEEKSVENVVALGPMAQATLVLGHTSLPLKPLAKGLKIRVAPLNNFMFGDSIFGSLATTMFGQ